MSESWGEIHRRRLQQPSYVDLKTLSQSVIVQLPNMQRFEKF